jgi:hypothetical protein
MGPDDLRSFAQMASGLTVATTAKAREVVTGLLSQGMTLSTRAVPAPQMVRDNRELLVGMIRTEVDKAVGRMGFVREDELAALRRHVERIEHQVNDLSTTVAGLSSRMVATAPPEAAEEAAAPAAEPAPEPSIEDLASGSPATQGAPDAPVKKKKKIIVDPDAAATS